MTQKIFWITQQMSRITDYCSSLVRNYRMNMDLWRGMNGSTSIPLEPSPWGSPYQVACPEIQPLLYPLAASKLLENTPGSPARVIRTSTPAMQILSAAMILSLFDMAHPVIFFSMIPHSLLLKHFYDPIVDTVITSGDRELKYRQCVEKDHVKYLYMKPKVRGCVAEEMFLDTDPKGLPAPPPKRAPNRINWSSRED